MASSSRELGRSERAQGLATIMAIGTANPSNCVDQSTFPDYYFRVSTCEHKTELKDKFRIMCENSTIKKRYLHMTEETFKRYPNICQFNAPSLNARRDIVLLEVPALAEKAASKAIEIWGQPKSKITHLIFGTNSGTDMPGPDYRLAKLLGLLPSVKRFLISNQGWFIGGTVLGLAKDLAENNKNARVLVVCSEISAAYFQGPSEIHHNNIGGVVVGGDGAAAVIVGSDPTQGTEKPLFEIVSSTQTTLPDSDGIFTGHLRESGLMVHFTSDIFRVLSSSVETILVEAFKPLGISDWNSLFWVVHPGGASLLDQIESKLGLKPDKLWASRRVLSEYGNMSGVTVMFILNEMRKKSVEEGLATTGDGLEWGVLFGFGHGLTVETLVLHSLPL